MVQNSVGLYAGTAFNGEVPGTHIRCTRRRPFVRRATVGIINWIPIKRRSVSDTSPAEFSAFFLPMLLLFSALRSHVYRITHIVVRGIRPRECSLTFHLANPTNLRKKMSECSNVCEVSDVSRRQLQCFQGIILKAYFQRFLSSSGKNRNY